MALLALPWYARGGRGVWMGPDELRIALACDACGRMRAAHFANS